MSNDIDGCERMRRKLWVLASELELSRDDRLELASIILRRDVLSWKHLDETQILRLLDAMEGYEKISWLLRQREM